MKKLFYLIVTILFAINAHSQTITVRQDGTLQANCPVCPPATVCPACPICPVCPPPKIIHDTIYLLGPTRDTCLSVPINQIPSAKAGNDIAIQLPTNSTTLTGSGADIDGQISGYSWSKISGPTSFSFGNQFGATTSLGSLVTGTYTFRLTVSDNRGATGIDDVNVTVVPAQSGGTTTTLSFAQRTDDYPRTGAGSGQWHGGYEAAGVPQSLDRYDRLTWYQLEPVHGDYKLTALVSKINAAIDKGQMYQFGGVMTGCPDCDIGYNVSYGGGTSPYPLWLHTIMQTESTKDALIDGTWVANYNSENGYLIPLNSLIKAIYNLINTGSYKGVRYKDVVNEFDIRGYGSWGEWNRVNTDGGPVGTAATMKRIIQMHIDNVPDIQLIGLVATYDGGRVPVLNIPAEVGYFILTAKNNVGRIGSRRDSYTDGAASDPDNYLHYLLEKNPTIYNGVRFDTLINNLWKYAPLRGESVCGGPVEILADQVKFYHTGSFGNGNFCLGALNTTQINAIKAAAAVAGYRITLTGGSVTTGSATSITLNWSNVNRPPTYDNWEIVYQVNGVTIGKSSMNLRLFTGTKTVTDTFTGVPAGKLTVKVVDPAGYRKPMTLAVTGQAVDGSIPLVIIN